MAKKLLCAAAAFVALALCLPAAADNSGQFTELDGTVTVKQAAGTQAKASLGFVVKQGDVIKTEANAKATILFLDGSVMRLAPSTEIKVEKLALDEDKGVVESAYDLAYGTMMGVMGSLFGSPESSYDVNTPTAVSGVRGSIHVVSVTPDPKTGKTRTTVVGLEGITTLKSKSGGETEELKPGEYGVVDARGKMKLMGEMSERDLDNLLNLFTYSSPSINDRAMDLRKLSTRQAPKEVGTEFVPPQIVLVPENVIQDYEDLAGMADNPADLIFIEPPGAATTELNIIIVVPTP